MATMGYCVSIDNNSLSAGIQTNTATNKQATELLLELLWRVRSELSLRWRVLPILGWVWSLLREVWSRGIHGSG